MANTDKQPDGGRNDAHHEVIGTPIAVVGISCWYPGARGPAQLWENILARRREFRRMPDQRLPLSQYFDRDPKAPDKTYGRRAAVIDGFQFDWSKRRFPERTYQSTDIAHWLALEVAISALQDAGYDRESAPRDRAAVVVGNTLTGEQTRASTMRLRWPFVRRALLTAAALEDLPESSQRALTATMEQLFKSVFPPITDDSLAGGLSNTIAGRICNYFDFHAGGYNVDGACCSSLLAVCTAANHLAAKDADLVLAGGVDISLDTFELVGFAKTGALSADGMRVYDKAASGFIPGEGCGFVVLKRLSDARAAGDHVYATIQGWGISSDGKGGITRPSRDGQALAIQRAYERAGYSPETVDFVEGHGTGTPVGDKTELEALAAALERFGVSSPRSCGITSFKSISGHTKAAAGVGAFIKAAIAANRRVIPPTASCKRPNEVFETTARTLFPVQRGEVREATQGLRVGISAMGFGGINTHVTIESGDAPRAELSPRQEERALLASYQDTEVFVFGASTVSELLEQIAALSPIVGRISDGELVDLAKHLSATLPDTPAVRAAVVADSPEGLSELLNELPGKLRDQHVPAGRVQADPHRTTWIGSHAANHRIGFLFPGQGSQQLDMGRVLVERYGWARRLVDDADQWVQQVGGSAISPLIYRPLDRAAGPEEIQRWKDALSQTEVAQPAICLASLMYARHLANAGLRARVVGGHSLGELAAFHLAGAIDPERLIKFATIRGQAMRLSPDRPGTMGALMCTPAEAEALVAGADGYVTVANINGPRQVVISGEQAAVLDVIERARSLGITTRTLNVSNAFHSELITPAAQQIKTCPHMPPRFHEGETTVLSGMDGERVGHGTDLREYFSTQVLSQVDFVSLVQRMRDECDLMIEVGPGQVLSKLVGHALGGDGPVCLPVASEPGNDRDWNTVLAAAFVHGADIDWEAIYEGRLVRPFHSPDDRLFIDNPCERPFRVTGIEMPTVAPDVMGPRSDHGSGNNGHPRSRAEAASTDAPSSDATSIETRLLGLVHKQTGYPADSIPMSSRLLDDLNLDSIKASEFVAQVVTDAGLQTALDPTMFANATLAEIADAIRAAQGNDGAADNGSPSSTRGVTSERLLQIVQKHTGYPADSIPMTSRLLDDLNLDSIKAAEFVGEVAETAGLQNALDPTQFANATLAELLQALQQAQPTVPQPAHGPSGSPAVAPPGKLPGPSEWVREFSIQYVPQERRPQDMTDWLRARIMVVCEATEQELASSLTQQLRARGATAEIARFDDVARREDQSDGHVSHWVAILPRKESADGWNGQLLSRMMQRLHSVATPPRAGAASAEKTCVAYVQFGHGASSDCARSPLAATCGATGFAQSLHLERSDLRVRVVDLCSESSLPEMAEAVLHELSGAEPMVIASYDSQLARHVPQASLLQPAQYGRRPLTWSTSDVILVTGGAKGITAECAEALGQSTGAKLALVGSSPRPENGSDDSEVARTLRRLQGKGVTCRYYACDITDAKAVDAMVAAVTAELGTITAVVHGAGVNRPRPVDQAKVEDALAEVAPKVLGACNLFQSLEATPPRLFVAFTSIIGVTGMPGNAWYAFSNETLHRLLREYGERHPQTQTQAIAFSVWDEVGMGARLGSIDRLAQIGIGAIPVREGVQRFLQLFEGDPDQSQVIVTARLGGLDTWQPKPLSTSHGFRFMESVDYVEPDVELTVRARLTLDRDRYALDHIYNGSHLFPTVFGLEAMAQAVAYVTGQRHPNIVRIENISLKRPIVIDPEAGIEIGMTAHVGEAAVDGERSVRVGIRTSRSGFAHDHFAATFVLGQPTSGGRETGPLGEKLDIEPERDLYGDLLFQGPLFQRMESIHALDEKRCVIRSYARPPASLNEVGFAPGQGTELVLGDAFFRDLLLQSIQLTIPQDVCLPVHLGCIERFSSPGRDGGERIVRVLLQRREGEDYVGQITATDEQGNVVEKLTGYRVRILQQRPDSPTAEELASPETRDERLVRDAIQRALEGSPLNCPHVGLGHRPHLQSLSRKQRRRRQKPVIARTLQAALHLPGVDEVPFQVRTDPSGKPRLHGGTVEGYDLSLSHDDSYLLCTVGMHPQGCDIEPITSRTREEWVRILGRARSALLDELVRSGDRLDCAATRVWSALEAVRKAYNGADPVFGLDRRVGPAVMLHWQTEAEGPWVVTVPVRLTRGPERMLAVHVSQVARQVAASAPPSLTDFVCPMEESR